MADTAMRVIVERPGRALPASVPAATIAAPYGAGARRWPLALLLVAIVVGAGAFRWYLLLRYYVTPDADQTVLGLMARHILAGERPVFYWGQPYTGAPEAYATAGLFAVFGQRDLLLHVVPLAASVVFVAATCALGARLYGRGVAALTGLYLGAAPILLIEWSAWAGSGYLEMMALGTLALLLALPPGPGAHGLNIVAPGLTLKGHGRIPTSDGVPAPEGADNSFQTVPGAPPRSRTRLPLAFFLLGLAGWIQPTAIFYALGVLALLVGRAWAALRAPRRWPGGIALTLLSLAALALGMAPMLLFNLQHQGQTLTYLLQRDAAGSVGALTVLSRALLWSGPVVLGLIPPTTDRTYLYRYLLGHYQLYGVALFVVLALLFRGLSLWRALLARLRTIASERPAPDIGLIVLVAALLAGFLSSSWGAEQWSGSQPRYLLPIYTAVPLIIRAALPRRPRPWMWAIAALVMLALSAGNFYTNTTTFGREDVRPLARLLEARGIAAVYSDYWLAYPLIFESEERIAAVATNDDLSRGYNRRLLYLQEAAARPRFAWIVATGSARQRAVLSCFRLLHSRYTTFTWRGLTVYDHPTNRAYPYWNGGQCPVMAPPGP